jgi:cyclopropane fatty-acyl-phospholipid synthase-like methyltransferase
MNYTEFQKTLMKLLELKGKSFGTGKFYQSLEKLGIQGVRPTESRFQMYQLEKILSKNMSVLDIGCNCGFFCIHMSYYVNLAHGIEPNKALVQVGRVTTDYLNISNCEFFPVGWNEFKPDRKYQLILSLAAHKWVKDPLRNYISRVKNMLDDGGYFFIESHHLGKYDKDWKKKISIIESFGFKELWNGDSSEPGRPRKFSMFGLQNKTNEL